MPLYRTQREAEAVFVPLPGIEGNRSFESGRMGRGVEVLVEGFRLAGAYDATQFFQRCGSDALYRAEGA